MDISYFEQKFSNVLASVRNAKKNNTLVHSYLIYSDNADVREKFAFLLARLMQCIPENAGVKTPCGVCANCRAFTGESYPDLTVIEPGSKSRRIVIGKDEGDPNTIRWFQARFSLSSINMSSKKIGIIMEADRLMPEAQNAFLKTLEEPPRNSYFILASERPRALLPTVVSRCQTLLMLTNRCEYDFKNSAALFQLMGRLVNPEQRNMTMAMEIAGQLKDMFSDLYLEADLRLREKKAKELEIIEMADDKVQKAFKEKFEAAVSAGYTGLREKLLNAVYTWVAELYQLSLGVRHDSLSSSSIIDENAAAAFGITPRQAEAYLKTTERFVYSMYWNVSEELAICDYVMNMLFNK